MSRSTDDDADIAPGAHQAAVPDAAPPRTPVAVVEDHRLIALGVSSIVNATGDLTVTGTYPDVPALEAACTPPGTAPAPQVVVLDLRLNDESDPADNVRRLRELGAAVVAYTSGEDPYLVRRACEGGVLGVVRKTEPPEALTTVLSAAARGELTPSVDWASAIDSHGTFVLTELTDAERRILELYASGAKATYVARRVGLSTNTVNKYLVRIRRRLMDAGLPSSSRVDLLRSAQAEGLVPTLSVHRRPRERR